MRDPQDSDKGLHRLAAEYSSSIFWDRGFGVAAPSTYAERQINMPKVWQPILDAHIFQSYREAMTRISSHSSAAIRSQDDAVSFAASEWDRDVRTVWRKLRKFSATAGSSDTI
jgi:hypothetical protein